MRPTALITGAAGGMGQACARLFGSSHDLILTDVSPRLDAFTAELVAAGYRVIASLKGDLGDELLLDQLLASVPRDTPFVLLHTAGLSPSQADWKSILSVNVVATHKLVQAIEDSIEGPTVAILIASMAAHMQTQLPGTDELIARPSAPDFWDKIEPFFAPLEPYQAGVAYSISKKANLALAEQKAAAWGKKGHRIVTISPGLILTPMGQSELDSTPHAAAVQAQTPLGRVGNAMDIALAAQFLASDAASYITGSDLRVDGGAIAALRG